MRGKVRAWNEPRGYGFIEPDGSPDVFMHVSALNAADTGKGDDASYDTVPGPDGRLRAANVKLVGEAA
jgi:cold shock protein